MAGPTGKLLAVKHFVGDGRVPDGSFTEAIARLLTGSRVAMRACSGRRRWLCWLRARDGRGGLILFLSIIIYILRCDSAKIEKVLVIVGGPGESVNNGDRPNLMTQIRGGAPFLRIVRVIQGVEHPTGIVFEETSYENDG